MNGLGDLLLLAAIVALVIDGILFIWDNSWDIANGLGLLCFALAALAAAGSDRVRVRR
jgi:hypothetical protein